MLHLDFETRSACNLKTAGADVYSKHPTTDILCAAHAEGDAPVELWKRADGVAGMFPVFSYIKHGGIVAAYNAPFEYAIWNNVGVKKYGWPALPASQLVCVMAQAYAMALPGSLDGSSSAMGLTEAKDSKGHRIMMQLSQPRDELPGGAVTWWTEEEFPEKFEALYAYCRQDVVVERELSKRLMKLSPQEAALWQLDLKINQRGIAIDLVNAKKAVALAEAESARLDDEMKSLTGNKVGSCAAVAQLKDWLGWQGIEVASVDKPSILALLARTDLSSEVRQALLLRQEAAKTSVKKLTAMMNRADPVDGRFRNAHQYHGAGTGRWAGRGIQVQNFPRPTLSQSQIDEVFGIFDQLETGEN